MKLSLNVHQVVGFARDQSAIFFLIVVYLKYTAGDFLGGPVLKTAFQCRGMGLIPGWETKIPYASQPRTQSIKQKQYWNQFNKDFFKWST